MTHYPCRARARLHLCFHSWSHRLTRIVLLIAAVAAAGPVAAQPDPWPAHDVPYPLDSGVLVNTGSNAARLLWSDVVDVPDARWLRLFFDDLQLGFNPETGAKAVLRITSLDDGHSQTLDIINARRWQNTSAYFNGSVVALELFADPGAPPSRVVVHHARAGDPPSSTASICGPTDDRELSSDPRVGRGENGCTHWIINDAHHCLVSAGHCAFTWTVIEFNVPLSNDDGSMRHPGPEDQYPVAPNSIQYVDGGIGNDWGYYGLYPNSETGLTAYQAQGDAFELVAPPPPDGTQHIRITGNGITSPPVPPSWSRTQKTHVGEYVGLSGTRLQYTTDTSSGNSGSPIILEETGQAIGVHTHGGCSSGGGSNSGTGFNLPSFANAVANPIGWCGRFPLDVGPLRAGQQAILSVDGAEPFATVYFAYSLAGPGETRIDKLGVTMGLQQPRLAGSAKADGFGQAIFTSRVPRQGAGVEVWFQALTVGRTSTVVNATIN